MRRFHLALSTDNVAAAVEDYSGRLGAEPVSYVEGQYALWRTPTLNISLRQDASVSPGQLRHLGWEDDSAVEFTQEQDFQGIVWESFSFEDQCQEINSIWPDASVVKS